MLEDDLFFFLKWLSLTVIASVDLMIYLLLTHLKLFFVQ